MTVTLTFRYINAQNQQINWTQNDLQLIQTFNLANVDSSNAQQITGERQMDNPAPCVGWEGIFDALNAIDNIFSDLGVTAVTRDGANCIGALVNNGAVTLYLRRLPVPQQPQAAVNAGIGSVQLGGMALVQQVKQYVQGQQNLRVYIPNSNGTGHQTTSCNIMRRIASMGFAGEFQVVYEDKAPLADIIQILLPELNLIVQDNGSKIAAGPGQGGVYSNNTAFGNCTFLFIALSTPPTTQLDFGISGGVDSPKVDPRQTTIANVKFFLMLQPFQWAPTNYMYSGPINNSAVKTDLATVEALGKLNFVATTCFYVDYAIYTQWNAQVNPVSAYVAQIGGTNPQNTQAAVRDIQAQCCAQGSKFNLLPVYGLTAATPNDPNSTLQNWNAVKQIAALANIVIAVLNGQANAPLNRGTVIMTLDAYAASWPTDLQQLIPADLYARLSFWQNGSAWNATNITSLNSTQVLIANIPKLLPMPVFNYFYFTCPLPPIFEGKGTVAPLLNSGRPYLQLSKQANGVETVYDTSVPRQGLKFTIYPTLGAQPTGAGNTKTIPPGSQATECIAAGDAAVRNLPGAPAVSAATFSVTDEDFVIIKNYLQTYFFIDGSNKVTNKFKALTAATEMDNFPGQFPITQQKTYDDIQTECGTGNANVCTMYRNNLARLTTFLNNGTVPNNNNNNALIAYFTGLGAEFHNEANDKLIKGLSYAMGVMG